MNFIIALVLLGFILIAAVMAAELVVTLVVLAVMIPVGGLRFLFSKLRSKP